MKRTKKAKYYDEDDEAFGMDVDLNSHPSQENDEEDEQQEQEHQHQQDEQHVAQDVDEDNVNPPPAYHLQIPPDMEDDLWDGPYHGKVSGTTTDDKHAKSNTQTISHPKKAMVSTESDQDDDGSNLEVVIRRRRSDSDQESEWRSNDADDGELSERDRSLSYSYDEQEEGDEDEDEDEDSSASYRGAAKRKMKAPTKASSSLNIKSTHWCTCDKCGVKAGARRTREDSEFRGNLGDMLYCTTCALAIHESCQMKHKKSDVASHAAAVQKSGIDTKEFQCSKCFPVGLPSCHFCNEPPDFEEPARRRSVKVKQVEAEDGVEPKPVKLLTIEDVHPFFRCDRCRLVAHCDCLVDEYKERFTNGRQPSEKGGTKQFYMHKWMCNDCLEWPDQIENVLTFRVKDQGANSTSDRNGSKEFFVKFVDKSHRWNAWVPESWVMGQRKGLHPRTAASIRDGTIEAEPISDVVPPEWIQVDKVLDLDYNDKRRQVRLKNLTEAEVLDKVDEVLIKWKDQSYESCTWEKVSDLLDSDSLAQLVALMGSESWERELKSSLMEGIRVHLKSQAILGKKSAPTSSKSKLKELKAQPKFMTGGTLKDYQLDGLNWLLYNHKSGIPCILADDMGLGKTLQTVAYLSTLYHDLGIYPFLIIVPVITLGHWLLEFKKWSPELVVVNYSGSKNARKMILQYEIFGGGEKDYTADSLTCHVIVSSYETMLVDSGKFSKLHFHSIVCDEGHRLKNDLGKTFKAMTSNLTSTQRVILTGTPLQNNVRELFNILNFLDPERWNDHKVMSEKFEVINDDNVEQLHEATLKAALST
ncbi:hypothetical protein HDU76_009995 [Blyttiomyces sp. JEL0837]|nr:hypothetical protein HDU76_009995 [Blyttiomyces sp. JEL0837]